MKVRRDQVSESVPPRTAAFVAWFSSAMASSSKLSNEIQTRPLIMVVNQSFHQFIPYPATKGVRLLHPFFDGRRT